MLIFLYLQPILQVTGYNDFSNLDYYFLKRGINKQLWATPFSSFVKSYKLFSFSK